jgi:hypothetical protein
MSNYVKTTISLLALTALVACNQAKPEATASATNTVASEAVAPTTDGGSLAASVQGTPAAGSPVTVLIDAKGKDGKPASNAKEIHIMLVDGGLEDFLHAAAKPTGQAGQWSVTFTPKFARAYKVYAEIGGHDHSDPEQHKPGDDSHERAIAAGHDHHGAPPLSAGFNVGTEPAPALAATLVLSTEMDGLVFNLSLGGPLKVGGHAGVSIVVVDKATGQPFTGLEPNFGLYGHLLAFPADGASMVEGHGSNPEPTAETDRGGPALSYELDVNQAGPMRLFLQVQRNDKLMSVPFTLIATS